MKKVFGVLCWLLAIAWCIAPPEKYGGTGLPMVSPTLGYCISDTALITRVREQISEYSEGYWQTSTIKNFLNLEIIQKTDRYLLKLDTTSFNTVIGTDEYALPADFVAPFLIFHKRGARWEPILPSGQQLKNEAQGEAAIRFITFNKRLRLISTPDDVHNVRVWYFKSQTAMAFTGAECPLDDADEIILIYGAAHRLMMMPKDPDTREHARAYKMLAEDEAQASMSRRILWLVSQNTSLLQYVSNEARHALEQK